MKLLFSFDTQGVEYGLEDRIQSIGLPKLYMKEISEEYF